ncbi:MAG: topoisomerase DNA-binding C4 zinc finger domain-containing protein [Acidimicrobiia bacterium]|nr:topoisomerase DNA-binding C4 zinc finger domain-containing protein [Acidimicrobiia bacterium]
MVAFLTTAGVNYHLEELIKQSNERLVLISPYLRLSTRIRDLLEDKNRMKIDIRVVYGKSELRPDENKWLESMTSIRTSYCANLHAKCYMSERAALVTSMNLYEFSQQNNHEMGVIVINRTQSEGLYRQIYDEAQHILRLSDETRGKVTPVLKDPEGDPPTEAAPNCPRCNEIMALRTTKRGANKGKSFWGCSTFPKCRAMKPIETP